MRHIMVVAGTSAALLAGTAVIGMAASASDAAAVRDGAGVMVATSFGPVISHDRRLRGEVVAYRAPEPGSAGAWVVQLRTMHRRRVANARVRAAVYMPEDSSVAERTGVAQYLGNGRYRVAGLDVTRPGWWTLGLQVRYRGRTDSLAFNLLMPAATPGVGDVSNR